MSHLSITVTTPNHKTYTVSDPDTLTDMYLDVFDCETEGTLAYMWANGGCFGIPTPINPHCGPVTYTDAPVDTLESDIALSRTLGHIRLQREVKSHLDALRSTSGQVSALIAQCKEKVYAYRILTRCAQKSDIWNSNPHVVNLKLKCSDVLHARTSKRTYHGYAPVSEGLTDTTELTDDLPVCVESRVWYMEVNEGEWVRCEEKDYTSGQLGHMYDAHVQEQSEWDSDLPGQNPRWAWVARCVRERTSRYASLLAQIDSMSMSDILRHYHTDTYNSIRDTYMAHMSSKLGFDRTPTGPWPGVRWCKKMNSLVRDVFKRGVIIAGVSRCGKVTIIPDMTDLFLTRAQMLHLTAELNTRVEKGV